MSIQKITVLKTFYSNVKRADYLLGRDKSGGLKLFKGFLREPFKLICQKDVFISNGKKVIKKQYFD